MGNSVCFGMAIDRMTMFSSGKGLILFDKAAVAAMKAGSIGNEMISGAAMAFGSEVKSLKPRRATKIKGILAGGFITRLKMESENITKKVNAQKDAI